MIKEEFRGREHYKIIWKFLSKIKKNQKLLEVGAGEDCILKYVLPKNIHYSSLDMLGDCDFKIDLNKDKLPFKDNTFDILVCLETLEHTFYPDKIIKEFKRVTKNDGFFLLSMPNEYNFWLRLNYLFAIKKKQTDSPFEVVSKLQHIHRPRVIDIINFFSKYFEIKKIDYLWQSKKCSKYDFFYYLDKIINVLAKFYPSLFARVVVIVAKNNNQ